MNKNTIYGLLAGAAVIVLSTSTYRLTNKQSTDPSANTGSVGTTSFTTQSVSSFDCATANIGIPTEECRALVILYSTTDGDNRKNNTGWLDITQPANSWYGVTVENGHVTKLDLKGNKLSGSIPIELNHLTMLATLGLNSNNLSGPIPVEISQLQNLQYLYLQRNQLSGPIPVEISQLNNLQSLRLSNNQLSGTIPAELDQLKNLDWINLESNQLSGPIPDELSQLANLVYLSVSNNQLSGPIPAEFGQLKNLYYLHVNNNKLSGPIPDELGQLKNLIYLNLENNQLCGAIPISFMNKNLGLTLSYNNLLDDQGSYSPAMWAWLKSKGFVDATSNRLPQQTPSACQEKTCGDGIVDPGEQCDGIGQAQCQSGYICNAPSAKFSCQCSVSIITDEKNTDKVPSSDMGNGNVGGDTTDRGSRDNNNPTREAR